MIIRFEQVTFKNFLSSGDQPTIINLDKTPTTIIVGENGAGKSTFIDAIVYALFGKPFRKVNLGLLINTVNESGLECEVTFSIGTKRYRVLRTRKPEAFEIYVDDVMIPQPATTADYQQILENDILKLNYKSFTQIIVLGSASFKPFMQLKLGDRREIIEDLLDISVFSEMNTILRGKIKETKEELNDLSHKFVLRKEQHILKRKYLEKILDDHQIRLNELTNELATVSAEIKLSIVNKKKFTKRISELEGDIAEAGDIDIQVKNLSKIINDLNMELYTAEQLHQKAVDDRLYAESLDEKIDTNTKAIERGVGKLEELTGQLADVVKSVGEYGDFSDRDQVKSDIAIYSSKIIAEKTRLQFYTEHDDCPECKQSIDPTFKNDTLGEINKNIFDYNASLAELNFRIEVIEKEMKEKAALENRKKKLENDIAIVNNAIDKLKTQNAGIQEDIKSRKLKTDEEVNELKNAENLLGEKIASYAKDLKELNKQNEALTPIKKELIVVQKDIAVCNQTINDNTIRQTALSAKLEGMNTPVDVDDTQKEIDTLADDIVELTSSIDGKNSTLHYFGIVQRLLRDDGLKTKIIRKFLPIINATLNMYLDKFDFPINFEFDENFNETIRSKYRSEFCYYSFSEGEKSRIDLALLFTWREIALKKSRSATNIIIFDEIFDGSLDVNGIENFMSILGVDKEGYNSFIISHKDATINNRFDRTLEFKKVGHFSKMEESE